jgi:hypothetical protein
MIVIARSPGTFQVNIFLATAKLSKPALVRVSDMNTSPLSSRMPMQ